jgi:hypothetical protein
MKKKKRKKRKKIIYIKIIYKELLLILYALKNTIAILGEWLNVKNLM